MVNWLRARLSDDVWFHSYTDRQTGDSWRCHGLYDAFRRDPADPTSECRMNAGFVKTYSVLLDYCVIYDGRVGAALGLLVRQFCEETNRGVVASTLTFAFGAPKEHPNAPSPKLCNPGL